jgi:hypothetical protein
MDWKIKAPRLQAASFRRLRALPKKEKGTNTLSEGIEGKRKGSTLISLLHHLKNKTHTHKA